MRSSTMLGDQTNSSDLYYLPQTKGEQSQQHLRGQLPQKPVTIMKQTSIIGSKSTAIIPGINEQTKTQYRPEEQNTSIGTPNSKRIFRFRDFTQFSAAIPPSTAPTNLTVGAATGATITTTIPTQSSSSSSQVTMRMRTDDSSNNYSTEILPLPSDYNNIRQSIQTQPQWQQQQQQQQFETAGNGQFYQYMSPKTAGYASTTSSRLIANSSGNGVIGSGIRSSQTPGSFVPQLPAAAAVATSSSSTSINNNKSRKTTSGAAAAAAAAGSILAGKQTKSAKNLLFLNKTQANFVGVIDRIQKSTTPRNQAHLQLSSRETMHANTHKSMNAQNNSNNIKRNQRFSTIHPASEFEQFEEDSQHSNSRQSPIIHKLGKVVSRSNIPQNPSQQQQQQQQQQQFLTPNHDGNSQLNSYSSLQYQHNQSNSQSTMITSQQGPKQYYLSVMEPSQIQAPSGQQQSQQWWTPQRPSQAMLSGFKSVMVSPQSNWSSRVHTTQGVGRAGSPPLHHVPWSQQQQIQASGSLMAGFSQQEIAATPQQQQQSMQSPPGSAISLTARTFGQFFRKPKKISTEEVADSQQGGGGGNTTQSSLSYALKSMAYNSQSTQSALKHTTMTPFPKSIQQTQFETNELSDSEGEKSFASILDSPLSPPITSKLMMEMSRFKEKQKELPSSQTQTNLNSITNIMSSSRQTYRGSSSLAANTTIDSPSNNNDPSSPSISQKPDSSSLSRRSKAFKLTVNTSSLGKGSSNNIPVQSFLQPPRTAPVPNASITDLDNDNASGDDSTGKGGGGIVRNRISFRDDSVQQARITNQDSGIEEEDYDQSQLSSPTSPFKRTPRRQKDRTLDSSLQSVPMLTDRSAGKEKQYEQRLSEVFFESYKNIEGILNENKHFKIPNKIEEDMLSVTVSNKQLLPRKLGILTKGGPNSQPLSKSAAKLKENQGNQQQNATASSNRRGTLADILEDDDPIDAAAATEVELGGGSGGMVVPVEQNQFDIPANAPSNFVAFLLRPSGSTFLNIETAMKSAPADSMYAQPKTKQRLNLAHLNISSKYALMIAKALRHTDLAGLHAVNLAYNHLDGVAVQEICLNFSDRIHTIDLSNNSIGPRGTKGLIPLFDSKRYANLRKLNLENNNITDNGLNVIIPSIFQNMSIYTLNFSHNHLSDSSCAFIKRLLLNSSYIQELYLHWNKFSSFGGLLIAQGLAENLNVKVLDLSHNGLGSIPKLKCGAKLIQACNVLESAVKHLDISYNQFSALECTEISTSLALNRSLYGVHLEGNKAQGIINGRGFFVIPQSKSQGKEADDIVDIEELQANNLQIMTQRIKGVKTKGPNKMQNFDCSALDNCWICHGWQEVRFEIKEGSSDLFSGEPAFLHLDFEDFQPVYMDRDPEDPTRFFLNRMCPPNRKITFFFTDPCKNAIYTSKDYSMQEFSIPDGINLKFETIVHTHHDQTEAAATATATSTSAKTKPTTAQTNGSKNKQESPSKNSKGKSASEKSAKQSKDKKKGSEKNFKNAVGSKEATATTSTVKGNVEGVSREQQKAEEQESVMDVLDEGTKVVHKKFTVKYLDGTYISYHAPTFVNFVVTGVQRDAIKSGGDYELNIKAIPRQPETFFLISKTNLWHRGISVFRDYVPDSDALDAKCFEFDWVSSKLPKLLEKGKDLEDCKNILKSVYPLLRIAYKYLSSSGIANDVFCITQNPFSNFAQKSLIIDNNLVFIRDIDFNFISASNIALKPKTYRNPDKALVRNEFLEVMGRIAMDKYIRNEKAKNNSEAITMFFHEEGLLNHLYEYDSPQEWRKNRYWNQECDEKLKAQLTFLKTLYNNFADSRKNEKRYFTTVKSLSLQEFKDFVSKYDLLDDLLVERDITQSFNLAMMTQVDELNSDRHFQMTFVEFLEAISRLAEKKSMVPLGEIPEEYDLQERVQVKLYYKIESLIAFIKKKHEVLVLKENGLAPAAGNTAAGNAKEQGDNKGNRKSMLSVNTDSTTPKSSARPQARPSKIAETSINFLRALTMKKQGSSTNLDSISANSGPTSAFDEQKESNKLNLKSMINRIMTKKTGSPTPSPSKKKGMQLLNEIKLQGTEKDA